MEHKGESHAYYIKDTQLRPFSIIPKIPFFLTLVHLHNAPICDILLTRGSIKYAVMSW